MSIYSKKVYERTKAWRKANPAKHKEHQRKELLKRKFGITPEDYNKMFLDQEGKCLICLRHQRDLKLTLAVDHSHITGEIRGLLCHQCNHAIGLFYENKESIKRALEYLA